MQTETNTIQPISPQQAKEQKFTFIPDLIIQIFNDILISKSPNKYITIGQDEVVKMYLKNFERKDRTKKRNELFENHWLDIEPYYRKAGWSVEYDGPGYCESYAATWKFKA